MAASKYYPLRQWQGRADIREVHKVFQENPQKLGYRESEEIAMNAIVKQLQVAGLDLRRPGVAFATLSQETQGVLVWGEWALNGRRVLHFTPELTQAFLHSDCGDMRIEDVEPEYRAQYFRFDMPEDEPILYSDGKVVLEGVYVVHAPGISMRVVLAGRPLEPFPVDQVWRERYDLRIKAEHFGKPAQDAIDLALADDLDDFRKSADIVRAKYGEDQVAVLDLLADRMQRDHDAFRQALRLVLNASAYLKIEAQDNQRRWSDGAPERLVRQVESGTPKELERANSKLWALGHVPIFHIGEEFGHKYHSPHAGPRAHWRKGHWRRQPHGPQLSLRKLIWIYPMLVASVELEAQSAKDSKAPHGSMP